MAVQDHCVIVGGSIAGLLAARVASEHFSHVTLIEREQLTDHDGPRKAVPQGHHIHALLARGQQILAELFPGLVADLEADGVPVGDFGTSLSWYFGGQMIRKVQTDLTCVAAGRPLFERHLRRRVEALPNVHVETGAEVTGLRAGERGGRVTGVGVHHVGSGRAGTYLDADLVIDASGRGSRAPRWLEQLGYPAPEEDVVRMDLVYTTCDFEAPLEFDPIGDDIALIPVATPELPRGAIFARLSDRYAVSLTGILGDHPPREMDAFLRYTASLPVPAIHEAVSRATPMGPPASFHFPASVRPRYDRMRRLPEGMVILGDAFARFNPVYGQGMTVAALAADLLRRHLANGPVRSVAFARDLGRLVDAPWNLAAGADLGFPGVQGQRTVATRLGNAYISRLQRKASRDPHLSRTFLRVAGLVDSPAALLRPDVVARTLAA